MEAFKLLLILYALSSCISCVSCAQQTNHHHNQIDDITTTKEVNALVKKIDSHLSEFKAQENWKSLSDCKIDSKLLSQKPFFKIDFDANGYTDLLVNGEINGTSQIFCILDSGNNRFSIYNLSNRGGSYCEYATTEKNKGTSLIDYHDIYVQLEDTSKIKVGSRLIYKFGDFIEYNSSPMIHE